MIIVGQKFKLLQNLPSIKYGAVFEFVDHGVNESARIIYNDLHLWIPIAWLSNRDWFEPERWKPEVNAIYWSFQVCDGKIDIFNAHWEGSYWDEQRYKTGLVFATVEETEKKGREIIQLLKK
jgi:hypothetical protein